MNNNELNHNIVEMFDSIMAEDVNNNDNQRIYIKEYDNDNEYKEYDKENKKENENEYFTLIKNEVKGINKEIIISIILYFLFSLLLTTKLFNNIINLEQASYKNIIIKSLIFSFILIIIIKKIDLKIN